MTPEYKARQFEVGTAQTAGQISEAFRIKDDWPQALLMSMGTLHLLAGLALEMARSPVVLNLSDARITNESRSFATEKAPGAGSEHPGLMLLGLGTALTLIGYLFPRKRAS